MSACTIHDGDHTLPCGARLTIENGVPTRLVVWSYNGDAGLAMAEAEELLIAWYDFDEDTDADLDEYAEDDVFTMTRMEAQPTHHFTDGEGRRLVRFTEEQITGPHAGWDPPIASSYQGTYLCALDRDEHEEDAGGWPPFLDNGVWRDGWTGLPIAGAKVEPIGSEAQA